MTNLKNFYKGKRILLTGHTGFKGSWMAAFLHELGGVVQGFALDPLSSDDLFYKADINQHVGDYRGNILDIDKLNDVIKEFSPQIVFHFAAQPLVIESYNHPRYTWEVNVTGTLNLLECLRHSQSVKSIVIITTDKVYKNVEKEDGYTEEEQLGGHDPYSSSKAAVEILVESMKNSFFKSREVGLSTARSGNVIGGGDWSKNRLIPDFYRAYLNDLPFELRNPSSIRPWQHVLDVLHGYIILGMKLYSDPLSYSSAWNFGPSESELTTRELIEKLNKDRKLEVIEASSKEVVVHETKFLRLNSSKSYKLLNWKNLISIDFSLKLLDEIYVNYHNANFNNLFSIQIKEFIKVIEKSAID